MEIFLSILNILLEPLAIGLGAWVISRLRKPKDWERAAEVEVIARAAARMVVAEFPEAQWADMIRRVVDILGAGVPPTSNPVVLKRAAIAALVEAGAKKPS